jgi:hypothetical protein
MNVDTDQVNSASKILQTAAGTIPAPLPKLSVPGTDPLSLAVAKGAIQVEAPMVALPGIKAEATTTAQNIGLAGQKYAETDETLARKAREQQFATGEDKESKEDAPDWSYNDVAGATAEGAKAEAEKAGKFNKGQLDEVVRSEAKAGDAALTKAGLEDVIDRAEGVGKIAKGFSKAVNFAEVVDGVKKGYHQIHDDHAAPITAFIDQGAHTFGGILAGGVGAEGGAALGGMLGTALIPIPGVGTAIGAGFGALAGSLLASDAGKAAGDALAAGVHKFASAGSFTEAWSSVPGTLKTMGVNALDAVADDVTGVYKNVLGWFSG